MSVFKKTFTKPLPPGAEVFIRGDQHYASWTDRYGRKRTARIKKGQDGTDRIQMESSKHVVRYRDAKGVVHEISSGCRSKDAARSVQAGLQHRVELVRAGVLTASDEAVSNHTSTLITTHVETYLCHEALQACPKHVKNTARLLTKIIKDCKFERLSDLQASSLVNWLTLRQQEGMGARTLNTYSGALRSFAAWCVADNRLQSNPFTRVPKANVKAGRRRWRRALTEDEVHRLLKVAHLRPLAEYGRVTVKAMRDPKHLKRANWTRSPLSLEDLDAAVERARLALAKNTKFIRQLEQRGRERALVYKMLVLTGLRRGELASLTVSQVVLEGNVPHLILNAADEKNRKGATIPLRKDLALDLQEFLRNRAREAGPDQALLLNPMAKLLKVPISLVRSLNRDLAAAGIRKFDERGYSVDVHALRHTLGTMLCRAGVSLRTAQALMRHSDPRLTANTYTDPVLLDVAGAVQSLPALPLETDPGAAQKPVGNASTALPAEAKQA